MTLEGTRPADPGAFLRGHPPFDTLGDPEIAAVAAGAELEHHPPGAVIFEQGAEPPSHLRVVRDGTVEIVADGRVIDVLSTGEMFGHASMLSGLPTGFSARTTSETSCYRIGAEVARTLLSAPGGLRFVARSLLEEPTELHELSREPSVNTADQPVGTLIRGEPVVCGPQTSIRDAVGLMSAGSGTAVVIDLGSGGAGAGTGGASTSGGAPTGGGAATGGRRFGILTDRDLRTRVVAAGVSSDAPVSEAMSAPAYTCTPDRRAGEVLAEMFERGLRHMPVVSPRGEVLGVVEDVDLVALRTRSSFYVRQRIATAHSDAELVSISRELRPMVISLFDAGVAAANVMSVYSVCVDALTRRLLMLSLERREPVGVDFAWLALGSQARREALPSSDVDSAIVWFDDGERGPSGGPEEAVRERLLAVARDVTSGLRACGLRIDEHGASADTAPFVRSVTSWQRVARSWMDDPTQEKALILSSVIVDSRPVWGVHTGTPVSDTFRAATDYPQLLRMLARFALSHRPATGRFRGLVVEHGGEHPGAIDLKHGGLIPILDLARWGAIAGGVPTATTPERLRAAATAGTLTASDAHTLRDAFELVNNLRLEHQVNQMRAGRAPDDHVDPHTLSPLMRAQLRQTFRAVAQIQRRVAGELTTKGS